MKNILLLLTLCFLMGCRSKKDSASSRKIEKIPESQIDMTQRNRIEALGEQILMTCNTSKFKPFTEKEATAEVRKNMTIDRLTKTCLKFKLKYGHFKNLTFVEAYKNKPEKQIIYRYKAHYQKKIANKELRITVNENNQIAAVNSKDWKDEFVKPEVKTNSKTNTANKTKPSK
ncbi:hypothetical protein G4D82_10720 [Flavobacterium sp. CYK-4]|uniref:hypothetical protein n=1 Tax=Flavobacterium lotistagni TaxID=2709660 RepID=UPI0014088EAA|nr:hypothetical protein [Flavobacterium lotistagni]NHM07696.1 hypothetical protein [Flavobacterium lotistagni]